MNEPTASSPLEAEDRSSLLYEPSLPANRQRKSNDLLSTLLTQLLEAKRITQPTLERAQHAASESGERIDQVLIKLGLVSEDTLTEAWSDVTGKRVILAKDYPTKPVLEESLRSEFLRHAQILPLSADGGQLTIVVADPLDTFSPAAIAAKLGLIVDVVLGRPGELKAAISRLHGSDSDSDQANVVSTALIGDIEQLRDLASDAPVIRAVNEILDHAIEQHASDIHLVATEVGTRVKIRIDGVLRDHLVPLPGSHPAIISRLKILGGLDIAERRLPQDGRIQLNWRGRKIDLRVATMPHIQGEGAVLRILDRAANLLDLESLGFDSDLLVVLRRLLAEPHGLFVVTGPTGSGKTTTLYAALAEVARPDRNIITVEDPVEYHIPGINQVQVNQKIGLDFSSALRSALRQDPDVIMVGEIRDRETALIANQAALTGHLVLATVHTNTATAAVPRLVNMGVEPYLLASTLRGAMAQRLVRRLCIHCRQADALTVRAMERLASTRNDLRGRDVPGYAAIGCAECQNTGYASRTMISELMLVDDRVRAEIARGADEMTIAQVAAEGGMSSMSEDGFRKVKNGDTSLSELFRVLGGQ